MKQARIFGIAIALAVFLIASMSIFVVREGNAAIILRLGKITGSDSSIVLGPGLHFKIPLIDSVRGFDMRLQQLSNRDSGTALTVVTSEQTYLVVDYFARWRIIQPVQFYTSTGGSIAWAERLLEQRLNDLVRAEYGRRDSDEAVSTGRAAMVSAILEQANAIGKDLGIQVSDVRIEQITLPKDVVDSVFTRMSTERRQFAAARRAEGAQQAEVIRATTDQQVTVIKAKAIAEGAAIRAKGDAMAAKIYADTYGAHSDFYTFYRSLEAYRKSFSGKGDIMVMQPTGDFFRYFHLAGKTVQGKG